MHFMKFLSGAIADPKTGAASSNKLQVWGVFLIMAFIIIHRELKCVPPDLELIGTFAGLFVLHSLGSRGLAREKPVLPPTQP